MLREGLKKGLVETLYDPDAGGTSHRIHPGGLRAEPRGTPLVSLLGSCVTVCLTDAWNRVGGMNHVVLGKAPPTAAPTDARYCDIAIERLLAEVVANGARREYLVAKIAGGARVLKDGVRGPGGSNTTCVKSHLRELSIPVVAEDLGGELGRKVIFFPDSGRMRVRKLDRGEVDG